MARAISTYRMGPLIGSLCLALLAAVCVAAVTQEGVRALLLEKAGGPGTFSVGVALLFLVGGLISLSGGAAARPVREASKSRASIPPLPTAKAPEAPATASTNQPAFVQPAKPQGPRQLPLQWTDEHGNRQTKLADVRSNSEYEFSLKVDGAFRAGQTVWVADEDVLRRGVVKSFEEGSGPRRLDVQLIAQERRTSDRVPGAGQASLHWSEQGQGEQKAAVTIRNFSENGLQVQSSAPVVTGQSVVLKGQKLNSPATVLYCRNEEDGQYLVGLRFVGNPGSDVAPQPAQQQAPVKSEVAAAPTSTTPEPRPETETVSALAERLSAPSKPPTPRLILTAPNRMG